MSHRLVHIVNFACGLSVASNTQFLQWASLRSSPNAWILWDPSGAQLSKDSGSGFASNSAFLWYAL